jgi:uncharacterized protein (TIGR04255 family)
VQLRFQPVLKIAKSIADLQDRLRPRFPGYESIESQEIEIGPMGIIDVRKEHAYRFTAASAPSVLTVTTSSFTIEYSAHKDRNDIISDVGTVLSALNEVSASVNPVRLGLRYVNTIYRQRISGDLNRNIGWPDLLAESFTSVPGGIASLDDHTNFMVEVSSPCARGKMTLRYGMPANLQAGTASDGLHFRVDTDRFIERDFKIDDVHALLELFFADIFHVFMKAAGPALLEWMSPSMEQRG